MPDDLAPTEEQWRQLEDAYLDAGGEEPWIRLMGHDGKAYVMSESDYRRLRSGRMRYDA